MHDIEMHDPSPEFIECWAAAGNHLQAQAQDGIRAWLKATPTPPFLEHLSFRLGNQLFFVRVEDADRQVASPGSLRGLFTVADGCNGHACLMPMRRSGGAWIAVHDGWGLTDARTGQPVDPFALVTDERIEMTDWELQDFASVAMVCVDALFDDDLGNDLDLDDDDLEAGIDDATPLPMWRGHAMDVAFEGLEPVAGQRDAA